MKAILPTKPSGIPWLGEVPAHWEVKRLKELCTRSSLYGMNEPSSSYADEGIRFLRTSDITDDGILLEEAAVYLEPEIVKDYRLTDGDVLLSRSGTLGRSFVYRAALHGPCSYAGYLVRFVAGLALDPQFAFYFTKSREFADWIELTATASTIGNVSGQKFANLPIPAPPIAEQRTIAAFLDERTARIDGLIARKQRLVQLLKEKRQALITRAVTRGLDAKVKLKESGVPWLGELPEHWGVAPVRHIAESIQTGPFGTQLHEKDYVEGGIPLINPAHLIQGRILPDSESAVDEATRERLSRYVLQAGDILFARRGDIGRSAMVAEDQDGWMCGTGSMRVRLSNCDPRYYAVLFASQGFAEALTLHAVGTTMLNINPTILSRQFVPRPPMKEQVAIRDYIETTSTHLDALVTKVEAAMERLQEYRTALISAAVTGKVRVPH